jgi:hypothetical protein
MIRCQDLEIVARLHKTASCALLEPGDVSELAAAGCARDEKACSKGLPSTGKA